eukprot:338713_1
MLFLTIYILISYVVVDVICQSNYWVRGNNAVIKVNLDNIDDYTISLNNTIWLNGGEPNVWCDQEWHSVSDGTLIPQSTSPITITGTDQNLGSYEGLQMQYKIISWTDNGCYFDGRNPLIEYIIGT